MEVGIFVFVRVKYQMIEILTEHPEATREYIASQTQRNINTIKTHFKWLIVNGYVKHIGPDNGVYWEVLKNNDLGKGRRKVKG